MPAWRNTKAYHRFFLAVCIAVFIPALLPAQDTPVTEVKVKGNKFLIMADTTIYVSNDSIVNIPVDKEYIISRLPPYEQAEQFMDAREKTSRNKFTSSLAQLTFVSKFGLDLKGGSDGTTAVNPYEEFEGAVIGEIDFKVLEPFGPNLDDTTARTYTWAGRFGNALHIESKHYVLRNYLLIHKGELLNPIELSDNEIILRELSFVNDVRIFVTPQGESDTVNLLFLIKDKFSFGINPVIKSTSNSSLKVWNENFYGLGHRIEGEISIITNRSPVTQFERGKYIIPNINGSFIRGEISYELLDGQDVYNISFVRGYLPPTIKTGLGMEYKRFVYEGLFLDEDSIMVFQDVDVEFQTGFLGRSFLIHKDDVPGKHGIYLTPAIGLSRKYYNIKPYVREGLEGRYRNSTLLYGSLTISQNNFYRSNYFYEFGRTENVPYGVLLNLTGGFESGQHYNRIYSGFSLSASDYIRKFGYLFGKVSAGGFYNDHVLQEGILDIQIKYGSKLFRIRHSNIRVFSWLWYTTGFNRLPDESIRFDGNKSGIPNFSSTILRNNRRISYHIEPVVFTPIMFLGFRFVFFGFAAIGTIGGVDKSILHNTLYQGYGLGVRIRNNNLVFNTLEVSIGFYPGSPSDVDNFLINVNGIPSPRFENFLPKPPGIIPYR